MGYTHYWTQKRNFTVAQWQEIIADLRTICEHAQHIEGIALANGMGDGGSSPEFTDDIVSVNGLGDDGHESFYFSRKRVLEEYQTKDRLGWSFCKTAHKPYDRVVTACLCYLSTVTRREDPASHEPVIGSEAFSVSSDGDGSDFLAGLDLARAALPRYANVLDIPMQVMESDRWCAPWVSWRGDKPQFEVHFCVDGHGYILRTRTRESYRFETYQALADWLESTKRVDFYRNHYVSWGGLRSENYRVEPNIWNAYGSFDKDRHARIAKAQTAACAKLFPVPADHAHQPPAYARPGEMPENGGREFCYSVADLLNLGNKAA